MRLLENFVTSEILPFATGDLEGTGGTIKNFAEDFRVDELPLYPASGKGDHVYFRITKRGLTTQQAISKIAKALRISTSNIASAGLKDANAITSRVLSIEHINEARIAKLKLDNIEISEITRHTNKLKTGHLAGNRFCVKIRDIKPNAIDLAKPIFERLKSQGVPNFFGAQRFGNKGDSAKLGKAIITQNAKQFIDLYLGSPINDSADASENSRRYFNAGDFDNALKTLPAFFTDQKNCLQKFIETSDHNLAIAAIDKKMIRLFISAYQSEIFNQILSQRIENYYSLLEGDWAQKHSSGGAFLVEDLKAEMPRCDKFEISPAGLIPGYRMKIAEKTPGEIEKSILKQANISLEDFRPAKQKGTRRALRYPIAMSKISAGTDNQGEFIELNFAAPPGCYATVLLEEITKVRKAYTR